MKIFGILFTVVIAFLSSCQNQVKQNKEVVMKKTIKITQEEKKITEEKFILNDENAIPFFL